MRDVRSILLVRLDGLGDAIACIPALEGLRRALPHARFGAICSPKNRSLFAAARMERVFVFDGGPVQALAPQLRDCTYDAALVATEEPVGYELARASGAPRRIGFWHRFEKTFKSLWQFGRLTDRVYRPAAWVDNPQHEVEALYSLASSLGAQLPIPRDAESLSQWMDVDRSRAPAGASNGLALQVTPKLATMGWNAEAIGALARAALDASGFSTLTLLAAPQDEALARAIADHASSLDGERRRILVAPAMSLPEWLGAIAGASALISPDTGAAHAAGMLGVPVVDLFDEERSEQLSRQWHPWASPYRCLAKPAFAQGRSEAFGRVIGRAVDEIASRRGAMR